MYAVAFDLVVKDAKAHHPSGSPTQAYADIRKILVDQHDFEWRQGSLYTTDNEDMAKLFAAINDLKATGWFPACVKDIRAFRVEQWSDFTAFVKS